MVHILDVESEVLIEMFHYVGALDLLRFKVSCSKIYGIIDDAPDLRYKIDLEKTGMLGNPRCPDSISERIVYLKSRDDAWSFFNVKIRRVIDVPALSPTLCDVSLTEVFFGTRLTNGSGTTGLMHLSLPFMISDEYPSHGVMSPWNALNLNMNILEFTLAVEEHDLVAFLVLSPVEDDPNTSNVVLVLLRHSTGKAHDRADKSVLWVCCAKKAQGTPKIALQICGENIAVAIAFPVLDMELGGPTGWLVFFDWRKGNMKSIPFPVFDPSIVFLREDILVSPNSMRRSLDIYHIPSSASMATNPPSKYAFPKRVRLIHALLLPELDPRPEVSAGITSFACRSSPSPTGDGRFPQNIDSSWPFSDDPECAIIAFTLAAARDEGGTTLTKYFHFIVHRRALLDLVPWNAVDKDPVAEAYADDISSALQRMGLGEEEIPFPDEAMPPPGIQLMGIPTQEWTSWGPPVTRWFTSGDHSGAIIANSAGQRYAQYGPANRISVLDFNPWAVRRAIKGLGNKAPVVEPHCILSIIGLNQEGEYKELAELEENICSGEGMFAQDIVGTLPFVKCTSRQEWDFDGVVMHTEALLGMTIDRERRNIDSMEIIYFG